MPLIEVTLTAGRTPQQVREMISNLTQAVIDAEVAPKESIRVIIREVPLAHFAAADVTLAERAGEPDPRT